MRGLSIIIVSYNTRDVTLQCIQSVIRSINGYSLQFEIIVIDNNSSDGSRELLLDLQKQGTISLICNRQNKGFGAANNQGIEMARHEYILLLNSDVFVPSGLDYFDLLRYLDKHKDIGVLTVKVILPNGKLDMAAHRGFPTPWAAFCYFFKLELLFGQIPFINTIFGQYHQTFKKMTAIHEIDSPTGAFYLSRRHLLRRLGGFDEDFFMYGEDLDLSYRIKAIGFRIIYYPRYEVIHHKYQSGLQHKEKAVRNNSRKNFFAAMEIFFQKHYASRYPPLFSRCILAFIYLLKIRS